MINKEKILQVISNRSLNIGDDCFIWRFSIHVKLIEMPSKHLKKAKKKKKINKEEEMPYFYHENLYQQCLFELF